MEASGEHSSEEDQERAKPKVALHEGHLVHSVLIALKKLVGSSFSFTFITTIQQLSHFSANFLSSVLELH